MRSSRRPDKSKAQVPVIAQLARRLDSHRCFSGNPANGLMFVSSVGKPVNLDAVVLRQKKRELAEQKRARELAQLRKDIEEEEKKLKQFDEWMENWERAEQMRRFIVVCGEIRIVARRETTEISRVDRVG